MRRRFLAREATVIIKFHFLSNPPERKIFGEWTGKNIDNYMAVVLNDEVK